MASEETIYGDAGASNWRSNMRPRPAPKAYIHTREEWGAKPALRWKKLNLPILKISFTVDTATPPCSTLEECAATVRSIQERQMNQEHLPDIAYNFLVGGDKNIYEGRGWYLRPQKAATEEECLDRTIDIAFIGKYGYPDEQFPWALYDTATELMLEGQDRGLIDLAIKLVLPEEGEKS